MALVGQGDISEHGASRGLKCCALELASLPAGGLPLTYDMVQVSHWEAGRHMEHKLYTPWRSVLAEAS